MDAANTTQEPSFLVLSDVRSAIEMIEKGVSSKDARFVARSLRLLTSIRSKLTQEIVLKVVGDTFPADHVSREQLLGHLSQQMSDDVPMADLAASVLPARSANVPEVEIFVHLLGLVHLIDLKRYDTAEACGSALIKRMQTFNRRMMDPLAAKAFFFFARVFELTNRLSEVRALLMTAHRTACIHHNTVGQAMLINLLLRNYLHYNQYDLADKLVSKAHMPETASNYQLARYHYYVGKIRSVQLDYTESHACLSQAIRKAPQLGARAFRAEVHKLLTIVQLLMGEIPERDVFFQKGLVNALHPYLQITRAVRLGDINMFNTEMEKHRSSFEKDRILSLIIRLRQNVIKTALRNISLAYSAISLQDVATKLSLGDVLDTEYVVAKAIADGVIDARVNHERGELLTKDTHEIYSTQDPQVAFHKRIQFCLKVHNDAVKAMRYPQQSRDKDIETAEERRARLSAEEEFARQVAEEEDTL